MSLSGFAGDLVTYFLQLALVLGIALPLPRLFGLRNPRLKLAFFQLLLAIALLLPMAGLVPVAHPRIGVVPELQIGSIIVDSTTSPSNSLLVAILVWIVATVALIRLSKLLGGLVGLRLLYRNSEPLPFQPHLVQHFQNGLSRPVMIRLTDRLKSPASFGWWKPVILLPREFMQLDQEHQEAIVCHEMLHLRRNDWPVALFEQAVRSILWFHPLVPALLNRIHLAREQVVDREVIRLTGRRRAYLETLRHAAETFRQASVAPTIPFARASHLRDRVAMLTQEVCMSTSRQLVTYLVLSLSTVSLSVATLVAFPTASLRSSVVPSSPSELLSVAAGGSPVSASSSKEAQKQKEKKSGGILLAEDMETPPRLIKKVAPVYPEEAKEKGISGQVVTLVTVNKEGKVIDANVQESPDELLSHAAVEAIRQWEWEPVIKDGQPVPFKVSVTVNFALK